ncbi:right-handed parallel beta-helix repeat-containing protein [Microbulbifer sp. VAAF005]|uniref:right-handed parallel beta-helix repeat-containing protein n=1 Tax=Microbulbifer sp. VAAF005 TaxID=3034230 RepID=UPI0024ACCAF6|nr:right-handed parallel beta-helix repeat-containing protein [Microbulbifer sp. VAAF005]WHI49134.1 right-handed parallel beta-helix repeat-containing protein [Microbulbifer sp. VAAF005]
MSNCGVSLRFQGDGFHFVSGINATDASMAGVIIQSTHNILTNVNSSDNNGTGIIIFGSDNTLNQVTVEENSLDGIITFADRILISDSQVSSNEPSGIVIQGSDDSSFIQNTFNSNSSFGMFVSGLGQTGNQMIGNTALNNGSIDLIDLNGNCAGAIWLGNTFDSANEACIE